METLQEVVNDYQSRIRLISDKLKKEKRNIYQVGSIRLLLFVVGTIGIIYFFNERWYIPVGIACITFIPFMMLIKYHNRMFTHKEELEKERDININELAAIHYDPSAFDGGEELIDPEHSFSFDLDLFGNKSLFQYINRTVTSPGRKLLSQWITTPMYQKEEIEQRQMAIKELAEETDFRHKFAVRGSLYKGAPTDVYELLNWTKKESKMESKSFYHMLITFVPLINFILILLAVVNVIPNSIPATVFVLFIFASFILSQKITRLQSVFEKKLKILTNFGQLISLIETKKFKSDELQILQSSLYKDEIKASAAIHQLARLMNALDQRNNIFIAAILNGLFFWELRQMIRIEAWKNRYAEQIPAWIKITGKMDALCSLAGFVHNNPTYHYPSVTEKPSIKAKKMGHPLMNRDTCVPNDLEIDYEPFFVIITGANMAGKSTYLRTVGINYLLACMGMPVDAEEMIFYPAHLVTSLRTSDSLTDNESYFFAELKRLKMIIDKLHQGKKLFIILDEILRGTNSVDKQKGSYSFIKQLTELGATGIIATHDLQLAKLQNILPEHIKTQCFEADIKNENLTFSYQLRDGVAQNMNACFLMKKMGINIVDLPLNH